MHVYNLWKASLADRIQLVPALAVQKVDNNIHQINKYPLDIVVRFVNTYTLDCNLYSGWHCMQLSTLDNWALFLEQGSGRAVIQCKMHRWNRTCIIRADCSPIPSTKQDNVQKSKRRRKQKLIISCPHEPDCTWIFSRLYLWNLHIPWVSNFPGSFKEVKEVIFEFFVWQRARFPHA